MSACLDKARRLEHVEYRREEGSPSAAHIHMCACVPACLPSWPPACVCTSDSSETTVDIIKAQAKSRDRIETTIAAFCALHKTYPCIHSRLDSLDVRSVWVHG